MELHDQEVRLIVDILNEYGEVLVETGTVFTWDDSSDHQWINGEQIYIEDNEVEVVS